MASAPAQIGDVIADKFRIERTLGKGGMGVVFEATHLALGQPVALKFMLSPSGPNEERTARFLREARATMRLKGQHVSRVLDLGQLDDQTPYIVMEYLRGENLANVLRARRRLPTQTAADYVLQACVGIAEAHAAGIIHRDLKPSNLFVAEQPGGSELIKVLDFGVSKLDDDESLQTATDQIMGSPLYMSPEQMRSARDADTRADIWGLGAILYQAVAGRPPFKPGPLPEVCIRVLSEPPEPLDDVDLPADLVDVIARCLAKEPFERPPSVAHLARDLEPFAGPQASQHVARIKGLLRDVPLPDELSRTATTASALALDPTVTGYAARGDRPSHTTGSELGSQIAEPASSRWPVAIAALGAIAAAIIAVVLLRGGASSSASPPVVDAGVVDDAPALVDAPAPPIDAAVPDASVRPDAEVTPPDARPPKRTRRQPRRTDPPEVEQPEPEPEPEAPAPETPRSDPRDRRN